MFKRRGRKEKEEDIFYNFSTFLEEISANPVTEQVFDYYHHEMKNKEITLHDVVQFITVSYYLHDDNTIVTVEFVHEKRQVSVNTCTQTLMFPVTSAFLDQFTENFVSDILPSPGFGKV